MHQAKIKYRTAKDASIRIESRFRAHVKRRVYVKTLARCVRIQAMARRTVFRFRYRRTRLGVIKIQTAWRRYHHHHKFQRAKWAANRLRRAIKSFLPNLYFKRQLIAAHEAAQAGDTAAVVEVLETNREVLQVRNRMDHFKLLIHSAAVSGDVSVLSMLDPDISDLMAPDALGKSRRGLCVPASASHTAMNLSKSAISPLCDPQVTRPSTTPPSTAASS